MSKIKEIEVEQPLVRESQRPTGVDSIKISGRIYNYRSLKTVSFLILKEEGRTYQLVVKDKRQKEVLNKKSLNDYLLVLAIKEDEDLILDRIIKSYDTIAEVPYPFYDNSPVSREIKLKYRNYELCSLESYQIFSFRSRLLKNIRSFFEANNHIEITTPKIISIGAEGGSELFKVRYFEKMAYLSQSPQLYKQMTINQGFKKCFEIGPIFRGEKSNTNRHLAEATSVDFEMELSLASPLEELIEYNILFLRSILTNILKDPNEKIACRAQDLLSELEKIKRSSDEDYNSEDKSGFRILDTFEKKDKPFYIKAKGISSLGFDIEYNGLELTSGGIREENYSILTKEMSLRGHYLEGFKSYLRTFKGGAPIQGGNAYGLERLMMIILEKENIRETTMYHRDRKVIAF